MGTGTIKLLRKTMQLFKILLLVSFISLYANSSVKDKHPAPEGFKWSDCGQKETNFLIPNNWFLKIEKNKDVYGVMISKEEIKNGKNFLTGLTVNEISNVSKKSKLKPTEYAKEFIVNFLESIKQYNGRLYKKPKAYQNGDFIIYQTDSKDDIAVMYHMLLANDKKDILYIVLFEAPVNKWEKDWQIGKVIIDNMIIDDEI